MEQALSKKNVCQQIPEETEDDLTQKYAIVSNGRRFKKDSRKWLHKSTSRCMQHSIEDDLPMEACTEKNITQDSCNGKNHDSVSFLQTFLESGLEHLPTTRPKRSCIRNVEENANSPELFRRKNKRRSMSPSLGKQSVRFDDAVEYKLRNFIEISHSFKPIKSPPESLDIDVNNAGTDSHLSSVNESFNIWQGEVSWRHSNTLSSDGSTPPTISDGLSDICCPVKRSKKQFRIELNETSRHSWDSTPSEHDPLSELEETPCGSPWNSLSLEEQNQYDYAIRLSKMAYDENENCN